MDFRITQGMRFADFMTHSKETGLNRGGSGEPVTDFDQGSDQDKSEF